MLRSRWAPAFGLLLASLVGPAGPAVAADVPPGCHMEKVVTGPGTWRYDVVCPPSSGGEEPGNGGTGAEPTCELTGLADYCIGTSACWANVPSALPESQWPEESRPAPEAIYTYQSCTPDPTGTLTGWSWYTPTEVTVGEAARQAFGLLAAPAFTVGHNPPGRAVVGLPTWFWAEGAGAGPVNGSAALGVVAIAEPARLEVDPGDGSGVVSCPWSTVESDACSHTYARASVEGQADASGTPSYAVRIRLVYDVRFEVDGSPLTLGGLPTTLESAWQTAAVPVAEIQTLVTSGG